MTNRIRVIAVAFCMGVLTSLVVTEPAGGAIDPKDWAMYCWKSGWKRYPLDKAPLGPWQRTYQCHYYVGKGVIAMIGSGLLQMGARDQEGMAPFKDLMDS